jgi:cation transport ATPase
MPEPAVMAGDASDLRCPGCGGSVDPLRAGHVAILDGRFEYFCGAECKLAYIRAGRSRHGEEAATTAPPGVVPAIVLQPEPTAARLVDAASHRPPPVVSTIPIAAPTGGDAHRAFAPADVAAILFAASVPFLGFLGELAGITRVLFATAAWGALAARVLRAPSDPADPNRWLVLLPAALAVLSGIASLLVGDPHAGAIAGLGAAACASSLAIERLVWVARRPVLSARERIQRDLHVPVRTIQRGETAEVPPAEVRSGEVFVVEAGQVVGVDAVVSAGRANVIPWREADVEVSRSEGDAIVAGARVTSGRLWMTTTWSGPDRAWLKLTSTAERRVEVSAPTIRILRRSVEWGAPVAGLLAGVAAWAADASLVQIVASVAAGAVAVSCKAAPSFASILYARGHLQALRSSIAYRDARSFENAGATDVAVLCARGTVLLGEPEIVAVEPVGALRASDGSPIEAAEAREAYVLSLAAGAETGSTHPFAGAILRAAASHGIAPEHVRNTNVLAGLGVTAIASNGERLVVGGRAIMLSEKVGGAIVEARVSKLEAQGRSVLLVALGDRLVGLVALQDGLRPRARAAVQKLLDAGIEPVLMSGDSRETCETIARALDIDHVRPEVLPGDRRSEVLALGDGGSVVGVIGHPIGDDLALGAADVAVAMGAAGATPGEWAVALASDDLVNAVDALVIPRRTHRAALIASVLALGPGLFALLVVALGFAPLVTAPLAALVGGAVAALFVRASSTNPRADEQRPAPP